MAFFEIISVYQGALLSSLLALSSFILYSLFSHSHQIRNRFIKKFGKEKTKVIWILYQRGVGIFLYGFIPSFVFFIIFSEKPSYHGFSFVNFTESVYWTLAFCFIIIPLSILVARHPSNQKKYPQIQTNQWSKGLLFISALSWIIYLFAYELLLRGILFFSCLRAFGLWPAVFINILIYAFFHVHKDYKETIGSVILGFLFCMITFKTGTIWTAFMTHVILALSTEWASICFNTKMKINLTRNIK